MEFVLAFVDRRKKKEVIILFSKMVKIREGLIENASFCQFKA